MASYSDRLRVEFDAHEVEPEERMPGTSAGNKSFYVGDITEFTLRAISIDDYTFGAAAVGPDGHESLIQA